ncbi:hypothetical protein EXIGLDRAFT_357969 [Exidia glandulosa HHB12029]|uniref:Uncharacterized protein n=1 Tax=Exidia glandulosa HHB12029 TaxID=1314781 RepID=A0A165LB95_EXIGL|nr:hypothetical protein EXIGLDRAFT_357969 [Exidia glandulosa HHB12029]
MPASDHARRRLGGLCTEAAIRSSCNTHNLQSLHLYASEDEAHFLHLNALLPNCIAWRRSAEGRRFEVLRISAPGDSNITALDWARTVYRRNC